MEMWCVRRFSFRPPRTRSLKSPIVFAPLAASMGRNLSMMRATTIASSHARWWLKSGRLRRFETWSSLWCLRSGSRYCASTSVSRYTGSNGMPARRQAALMKPVSKSALCAMIGRPPAKSRNWRMASASSGALATSASVMPVRRVISAGMGMCGLTNVSNSALISPPEKSTAPISVMRFVSRCRPVVSMSKAMNSVSSGWSLCPCTASVPSTSLTR